MRRKTFLFAVFALCALGWGCVENYSGTRLQANMWVGSGFSRRFLILPTPGLKPWEEGYFSHYEVYMVNGAGGFVRLTSFIIQPLVDVRNPCYQFMSDPYCIDTDRYTCQPYMNLSQYESLDGIFAVSSPGVTRPDPDPSNPYGYHHMPSYTFEEWPDELFVDPYLEDPALKIQRDNLIEERVTEFCEYCLPEGYYLGSPLEYTSPMHGELFGTVDGPNPTSGQIQGGLTLWLPGKLYGMQQFLIIRSADPSRINRDNIDRRDLLPDPKSQVLLVAKKDGSIGHIHTNDYRGVTTILMENPYALPIFMYSAVFVDMDEDPVNF